MALVALLLLVPLAFAQGSTATVTLTAVGDISLDGPVGRLIERHGPERALAGVKDLLAADIVLGNLECAITTRGEKAPKTWNFRAPPRRLAALKAGGFTAFTMANNHSMDYGRTGILDSLKHVRAAGFEVFGAGKDRSDAERLTVIEKNGLKVGLLGFTSTFPKEAWAKPGRPGVAYSDFARFPAVIREAREAVDALVVSFHGGTELAEEPNQIQLDFGRLAVEAGADLVLAHHPHVLQAVEVYKDKPILYSLGNFLFVSPTPTTRPTVIVRAVLEKGGVRELEFVPVDGNWGTPKPAGPELAAAVRAALDGRGALTAHPERLKFAAPPAP